MIIVIELEQEEQESELRDCETKNVGNANLKLTPDLSELKEAEKEVEKLAEKLREAKEIADSIASGKLDIRINAEVDGNSTKWAHITG